MAKLQKKAAMCGVGEVGKESAWEQNAQPGRKWLANQREEISGK